MRTCIPACATASPSRPPAKASASPSVVNCRISRMRDAPSAPRTAISRLRLSDRTSNRLDTFTQAITSSNPAPPRSAKKIGRTSFTNTSESGFTQAPWPRLSSGYWISNCRAIAFMSAKAASTVTPSLSRPMPYKL